MRRIGAILLMLALLLPAASRAETLNLSAEGITDFDEISELINAAGTPAEVWLGEAPLKVDTRLRLMETFPDTRFFWTISLFGRSCSTGDAVLNMAWKQVKDYDQFIQLLRCLPDLEKVEMYNLYVSRDNMALLTQALPSIRFGFAFQMKGYEIRTDDTSFSSLKDGTPPYLTSQHVQVIATYCKDMVALDLGHNAIDDISFLYDMPQLKILILACNNITDITPIGSLKNLEYLEIFKNPITDISALAGLENLIDLNVANLKITDVTPLMGLTGLERLWLPLNKGITDEQVAALRQALPDTLVNVEGPGSTGNGWRVHTRYKVIHHIFNYGGYLPWDTPLFTPQEP